MIVKALRAAVLCLLALSAVTLHAADNELTDAEKAEGWKLLFNGTETTGWANRGKDTLANWKAENGEFVRKDKGGDAVYMAEQFENFELKLDWKIADKGNSGVFIRMSSIPDWIHTGMEVQILDINESKEMGIPNHVAGALYDVVVPKEGVKMKPGEWNTFHIVCDGPKISCKMNGEETFAINLDEDPKWKTKQGKFNKPYATLPRKGYLMVQDHGALVSFKNFKIKPLATK